MILYRGLYDTETFAAKKKAFYCKVMHDSETLKAGLTYRNIYAERGSIKDVIEYALQDYITSMSCVFDYILEILRSHEIYNYDRQRIGEDYIQLSGYFFEHCADVYEQCCNITGNVEQMKNFREQRKLSRGRVIGGGFGLGGAVEGMITAGVINSISGLFHSTFNGAMNILTSVDSSFTLMEYYNNPTTRGYLLDGLKQDVLMLPHVIEHILNKELNEDWSFPFTQEKLKDAQAVINGIKDGSIDQSVWPNLLLNTIINKAPYYSDLYFTAHNFQGDDNGNLLEMAKFFSVDQYVEAYERNVRMQKFEIECEERPKEVFGNNLKYVEQFLNRYNDGNTFFLEDKISLDFTKVIKGILDERMYIENGQPAGELLRRNARRRIIFFDFDYSELQEMKIDLKHYIILCNANIDKDNEEIYAFIDSSSTFKRTKGILMTSKGLYFSYEYGGFLTTSTDPIFYRNIDWIDKTIGGVIFRYNGINIKAPLSSNDRVDEFIVFACAYFKYKKQER